MKRALIRTLRDMAILVAVICMIYGGFQLWNEHRAATASDFEMPTLADDEGSGDAEEDGVATVDFTRLKQQSDAAIAWITVPQTQINYPIAQWTDNKYFLDTTIKHASSRYGALFMDYRNSSDFSDFYTVVYGHNMRSGRMFGTLKQFREDAFFDSVKYGTLQTPEKTYQLQFFAWALADATGEYYANLTFFVPGEKEDFLAMLKSTAKRWRDIPLSTEDRILALSTCSYEAEDARTVVLAKLVEQSQ